jgi:hypothetical protein
MICQVWWGVDQQSIPKDQSRWPPFRVVLSSLNCRCEEKRKQEVEKEKGSIKGLPGSERELGMMAG